MEREKFWYRRIQNVLSENRLKDLAERFQIHRLELKKRLLNRAEKLLDRLLPRVDQSEIDKRIANYVAKLLSALERISKGNNEKWKAIFKAIDHASQGEENKWFRTLVADIDSDAFAAATDTELAKVFKKLGDSSKLFIGNLRQLSRRITRQREVIRQRVKDIIRRIPKVC